MFILQVILLIVILGLSLLSIYLWRNYNYFKWRGIPYAKPNFLFGNLQFLMRSSVFDFFDDLWKKYPVDCVGIFLGWRKTLVIQSPELARQILTKDFDKFQNRMAYSSYNSDPMGALNILLLSNPKWSVMRHELSPMFTSLRLKNITDLMNINATELVNKIKRDYIDKKEKVDLKEIFSMYASDTVGYSVFGINVSALNDPQSPLWYITRHMVKWTFWRGFEFALIFFVPAVAAILRLQLFSRAASDYIKKLFWNVVEERKKQNLDTSKNKDLVNHLLLLKQNLKLPSDLADELMLAQAAVFILGSIETSSTTLSYCLHELAYHPEEQEKLYQEVRATMKQCGKEVLDYTNLIEMKYLTACCLETMRKHSPVPYLDRVCEENYQLTDKITIERGTTVFINTLAFHHNPKLFPEPTKWDPERMLGIQETDNLNFTFLPFGAGPRFCIGRRYGMIQVRAAIAQVVSKYKILPDPTEPYDVKIDPYAIFLSPLSGGCVKFVERE